MTAKELRNWLAWNVRGVRDHMHLTLRGLADRSSISFSTLARIERKRGMPTLDVIGAWATFCGVPLSVLFRDAERWVAKEVQKS